jgi:hypothetical protein
MTVIFLVFISPLLQIERCARQLLHPCDVGAHAVHPLAAEHFLQAEVQIEGIGNRHDFLRRQPTGALLHHRRKAANRRRLWRRVEKELQMAVLGLYIDKDGRHTLVDQPLVGIPGRHQPLRERRQPFRQLQQILQLFSAL